MDTLLKDDRFSHIGRDPRFKRIPKNERKVKIDKRFQSMFEDKKFKLKYSVDKRGRPANYTTSENLKKFYDISSEESDDESDEDVNEDRKSSIECEDITKTNKSGKHKKGVKSKDNAKIKSKKKGKEREMERELVTAESDADLSDTACTKEEVEVSREDDTATNERLQDFPDGAGKIHERLQDLSVDYARGEGILQSDSSSDEETSDEDSELVVEHAWGELDRDAPQAEEATSRLAVCNMDWDRIRAVDLMVLFTSFVPSGSSVVSVVIYPSQFGVERMKEEDVSGPQELVASRKSQMGFLTKQDDEEHEQGDDYSMENLRQYQLNRLKYYYAVVTFDSKETAETVYNECDGREYESSAAKLDLRYIPEDMQFDEEPREKCDELPDPGKYHRRLFTTTALQQGTVRLTWDETDPQRLKLTQKISDPKHGKNVSEDDIAAYLACSSSDDDENNDGKKTSTIVDDGEDECVDEASSLEKYRSLLRDIEEKERKEKERGVEMEITWGVGLKEKTEALVKKRMEEKQVVTPFQQLLHKQKEKRKKKKEDRKKKGISKEEEAKEDEESEDDIPSDIDLTDPYFAEEFGNDFPSQKSNKKKLKKGKATDKQVDDNDQQLKAELELLLMDDEEDNRKHFNLKSILEDENDSSTKKKKRRKQLKKNMIKGKETTTKEDDFQVDVSDPRFSALFTSHHYSIDPSDSNYKKTKGMETILSEKLKRRRKEETDIPHEDEQFDVKRSKQDPELSVLVNSIKNKTLLYKKKAK